MITFYGPFELIQITQDGVKGKLEKARYRPKDGEDWTGTHMSIPPLDMLPIPKLLEGSWIEIECRTWIVDGFYRGSVSPTGRFNANWPPH